MSGVIYLMHGDGKLVPMIEQAYDSEDVLQRLLADYPDLLGGEQMDTSSPRRWLLLAREAGLPSEEAGGDRWSVDHLFVDQDGIPTIIEVKRSTDSRIRREVVGQMLDYAANAVVYWPVERLRSRFDSTCEAHDRDPETVILESLGIEAEIDEFWKLVQTNLQAGRVRLVFVADIIPPELRRVVEFLNAQMNPTEVLAVEVRQYVGQGQQALVPRVIGKTQVAAIRKGDRTNETSRRGLEAISEQQAVKHIQESWQGQDALVVTRILEWAIDRSLRLRWRYGRYEGFYPGLVHQDRTYWLYSAKITGHITMELPNNPLGITRFQDDTMRDQLIERLNQISTVSITAEDLRKFHSFRMSTFYSQSALNDFLSAFDWVIEKIRSV
jgi:hypothetical protein